MFGRQKAQTDIKKSTQKLLDSKKDVATRLKHLKLILDTVDISEAKALFSTHYSHIYHLVYEGIVSAEGSLKLRGGFLTPTLSQTLAESLPFSLVHRAQREELESVLHLLERILMLLPDLLHCRWQLHSMSRLMAKLNHPANSLRLRREAIRLFVMWYQCLGTAAPNYVHAMFSSLIPGIGISECWPPASDPSWGIVPLEITPVLPANPGERQPEDLTSYFMECLLDFMVSQAPKILWNEGSQMWAKSIDFLYERFKEFYLPKIFTEFEVSTNIYKPTLDLPEPRKSADLSNNPIMNCQVVFVKWIANYAHSVYRPMEYSQAPPNWSTNPGLVHHDDSSKTHSTPPSSLSGDRDSITSYSSIHTDVDANVIAKDVILGSRENVNFLHEVFRRALLMNFVHSAAIRRVICVYKDWIQINVPELPVFMLEPEEPTEETEHPGSLEQPKNRLRTDSYYGAIGINANNNREEYLSHLRAGAQKVLQVFFCNSASVFLLFQIPKHEAAVALLEEQVDICKRVLNIYRYAVMNTRMDAKTWEQLLVVMLHVTSKVLDQNQPHCGLKYPDTLGYKLASALFQTLIVSWVKASLNVPISIELWDQLKSVLSQLSFCDDLITEWAKTMETLTRVLSRHVYNLDLANLPLDRLTEQKAKKKRAVGGAQPGTFNKDTFKRNSDVADAPAFVRNRHLSSGTSSDRKSLIFSPSTPLPHRKLALKRSLSEGNILSLRFEKGNGSVGHHTREGSLSYSVKTDDIPDKYISPENRTRKRSRSVDSLRKLLPHFGHLGQQGALHPDWAEISSSTNSLENTSTIHIDGDSNSIDCGSETAKTEVKGVIAGGQVKGWLPSVAAILWRRMLGILGDVNEFTNPKTHTHFFQVLTDMWSTLHKIRQNQGVSADNTCTPRPPELVPPLTLLAPWCLRGLELSDEYHRGKVLACALLCDITMTNQDIPFYQEYLCKFYATIHKIVIANQQEMVNEVVKRCGTKFVSKMLPGFSVLNLDLVQASHSVLICDDLRKAPRMEAATLLGTVLSVSDVCKELPILKPNSLQFQTVKSLQTKEVVFSCLLQFAKTEQTSHARSVALQSLAIFLCKELMDIRHNGFPQTNHPQNSSQTEQSNRVFSIFAVLLSSLKVANRSVALVASDLVLLLADFAPEISTYFPTLTAKIIIGLKVSLQQALPLKNSSWASGKPVEMERRLLISLMLTLGEWCMRFPLETLLFASEKENTSLLSSVFEVLLMVVKGFQTATESGVSSPISLEDFDPSIPFDDLQTIDPTLRSLGKENVFVRPESTNNNSSSQDIETVRLAARTLMLHLLTQVGHFPAANGAARCGSIVSENDDLPGINSEMDELSSYIFSLPNLQMFALDNNTLLSIVELPTQDSPGGGVTSGFATSPSQVRIILRDLSGKASWDAVHLFAPPTTPGTDDEPPMIPPIIHHAEDIFYPSTMTGNFLPQMGPRLTQRRRPYGILPTIENSAEDLDNLDDVLQYVGFSSPECLLRVGESLSTPWGPPPSLTQDNEDDVVAAVVNQRNTELEYLMKFDLDSTMRAMPVSARSEPQSDAGSEHEENLSSLAASTKSIACGSSFLLSRRLFSQLGLNGWDKRSTVDLLNKDEKLLRELKHLDSQKCREAHKIAVIYVAEGQEDKQSILYNNGGSEAYEDFVAGLGWEVELESHTGFMGGLQRNKSSGETAPYFATSFTEVIFHVATRMPSNTEESLLQKTRHLGNDEVHIVWSEHNRDYRRDIIPTEFCDVLIVIYPLQFGMFRVQISRKPEVPYFGPLYNDAVVERDTLATLVRATAVNASRARRSSLQYFQHHFEERAKSLATIIQNHKSRTTFEQFASNVFCPLLPPTLFHSGHTNRASGTSFSSSSRTTASTITAASTQSNQLASALVDPAVTSGNIKRFPSTSGVGPYHDVAFSPPEIRSGRISGECSSVPQSPTPPVPPKRLSIKLGHNLKPKIQTPPSSPASNRVPGATHSSSAGRH